ncbi:helix-turn-helix domain-containing protein [Yokenella regensburgei]|uniref:helix-turn-helix domain-containing protein n=1 Tax=Yokenella regensburgei TaxID=158877 RepID=UPI001376093C|nr:helix-turn-helix domain-containing protein [Yokenella regensburgei]KAF1368748.1 transcriptional regulator with XRE-family HTH domain [Yokenella regensburgei]
MDYSSVETIGERIRRRRREQGKTLVDLGKEIGVSAAAISLWERGDSTPTGANMQKLCKALDCSHLWLVEGVEHLTADVNGITSKYTIYELKKLSDIFDVLPREYRERIVDYAQTVLEEYHTEVSARINKIKTMNYKK